MTQMDRFRRRITLAAALALPVTIIAPGTWGHHGLPSGPQKKLIERFAIDPDRVSLTYSYQLEDPEYLREPVSGRATWAYRPDPEFTLQACDRDNARRFAAGATQ